MRVTASYLERVARDWQKAYAAANDGKMAPAVRWEKGWFIVEGFRYRRAKLEMMTGVLRKVASQMSPADHHD